MEELNPDEVAYHGTMELKGAEDSHRAGYKVQLVLGHEKDYEYFKNATRRKALKKRQRRGMAGIIYSAAIKPSNSEEWNTMDLWLLGWGMSHNQGAVVSFNLGGEDDFRFFRDRPAIDAKDEEPAAFEVVLWELDDQGNVVNQKQREKLERAFQRPKGGRRSIHAARLDGELGFQVFVAKSLKIEAPATPDQCAAFVRQQAGVESRAMLDHNDNAWRRFHVNVESPYVRWRESRVGHKAIRAIEEKMGESDVG